jgi:hypothetical protein
MKRLTIRVLVLIAGLAFLAAWGWLVWPTPYRYTTWQAQDVTWPVRISRVTGRAEVLSRIGWLPMEPVVDTSGWGVGLNERIDKRRLHRTP